MIAVTCAAWLVACNGKAPGDDTPRSVVVAQDKVKDDFEKENPKWKFAAGKWERRSGILAQTAETQPWAVAILEDKKFADVDITVRFRPISGKEDASGGILFRARDAKNYYIVRAPWSAREHEGGCPRARRVAHDASRRQGIEDPGLSRRSAKRGLFEPDQTQNQDRVKCA